MKYPYNPDKKQRQRYREQILDCLARALLKRKPEVSEIRLDGIRNKNGCDVAADIRRRMNRMKRATA